MRLSKIDPPDNLKAEGRCNGLPYNTDLVSINGCAIHFWTGAGVTEKDRRLALHYAINARDIVYATWSLGEPAGFWAHQDIGPGSPLI